MKIYTWVFVIIVISLAAISGLFLINNKLQHQQSTIIKDVTNLNPLSIEAMRNRNYPGSQINIEQTLPSNSSYNQYLAFYYSDGLKIYALLTVPKGSKPSGGWPVILFNHGYVPPNQYQTTQRYVAYVDAFAKNGYIVFKPDYRGNGKSQGTPGSAYFSPNYVIDDLNALSSIRKYPDANPNRIGIWGHSMGGYITLKDLVISKSLPEEGGIKAAIIWGGVVGSYNDILNNWQNKVHYHPTTQDLTLRNENRQNLINIYGTPQTNPDFWNSIDPTYFISDITSPIQLDVGGSDEEVPIAFSSSLKDKLESYGKTVEYYVYPGSDHNISQGFDLAMKRSVQFFDTYLK